MIAIVDDPENYTLDELIQMYLDDGYDERTARAYAKILKDPTIEGFIN